MVGIVERKWVKVLHFIQSVLPFSGLKRSPLWRNAVLIFRSCFPVFFISSRIGGRRKRCFILKLWISKIVNGLWFKYICLQRSSFHCPLWVVPVSFQIGVSHVPYNGSYLIHLREHERVPGTSPESWQFLWPLALIITAESAIHLHRTANSRNRLIRIVKYKFTRFSKYNELDVWNYC